MGEAEFVQARKAEKNYHHKLYNEHDILEPGTWMSKPEPVVMELLEQMIHDRAKASVLDLGCGAGRHAIPIALRLKPGGGKLTGVDLLEMAVQKLRENAGKYGVASVVEACRADVEHYPIPESGYDYIVACGCLEHMASVEAMMGVVERMKLGTRPGGIHCLSINTQVQEFESGSGRPVKPLIELNLPTAEAFTLLEQLYADWEVLRYETQLLTIEEEKYEQPTRFRCRSITFAARKKG